MDLPSFNFKTGLFVGACGATGGGTLVLFFLFFEEGAGEAEAICEESWVTFCFLVGGPRVLPITGREGGDIAFPDLTEAAGVDALLLWPLITAPLLCRRAFCGCGPLTPVGHFPNRSRLILRTTILLPRPSTVGAAEGARDIACGTGEGAATSAVDTFVPFVYTVVEPLGMLTTVLGFRGGGMGIGS